MSLQVLLVTHDRAFLSAVAREIVELHGSSLWRHRGSYEDFIEAKQARGRGGRAEEEGGHREDLS